MTWKTKTSYIEDPLKTSSRRLEDQQMFAETLPLPVNRFPNKLAPNVPNNILRNFVLLLHI